MNTFLRYFRHRFIQTASRLLLLTLISVAVYVIYMLMDMEHANRYTLNRLGEMSELCYGMMPLAFCMSAFEFASVLNKRNSDVILSLPISRLKYILANYLNGALQLIIVFTTLYFSWFFIIVKHPEAVVVYSYLPRLYFSLLTSVIMVYTFFSCIYLQGRNATDGSVLKVLWLFFPDFVYTLLLNAFDSFNGAFGSSQYCFLIAYPVFIGEIYEGTVRFYDSQNPNYTPAQPLPIDKIIDKITPYITVCLIIIAVSLIVAYFTVKKIKANELGDTTDSWLGYKLLGPAYSIGGMILFGESPIYGVFVLAITLAGYAVYRRGLRFKKQDWIFICISAGLLIMNTFSWF